MIVDAPTFELANRPVLSRVWTGRYYHQRLPVWNDSYGGGGVRIRTTCSTCKTNFEDAALGNAGGFTYDWLDRVEAMEQHDLECFPPREYQQETLRAWPPQWFCAGAATGLDALIQNCESFEHYQWEPFMVELQRQPCVHGFTPDSGQTDGASSAR